jgi:hypothetical protein
MDDEDEDLSKHVGATVEVMELLIHTFPPLLQVREAWNKCLTCSYLGCTASILS